MLSAVMLFLGGVAVGLALWSGVISLSAHYTPIYYLCAMICIGLGYSLRRHNL